jgi:hypothetical protein
LNGCRELEATHGGEVITDVVTPVTFSQQFGEPDQTLELARPGS